MAGQSYRVGDILSNPDRLKRLLSQQNRRAGAAPLSEQQEKELHCFLQQMQHVASPRPAGQADTAVVIAASSSERRNKITARTSIGADKLLGAVGEIIEANRQIRGSGSVPVLVTPRVGDDSGRSTENAQEIGEIGEIGLSLDTSARTSNPGSLNTASQATMSPDLGIAEAVRVLSKVVTGEMALLIEAMGLAIEELPALDTAAPAAAPGVLTGQPKDVVPAAAVAVPVMEAPRASAPYCDRTKLVLGTAGALLYGTNYALVSAYEAIEVFGGSIGVKVLASVCASASFCANFAQIYVTLQKIFEGDIKEKFSKYVMMMNQLLRLQSCFGDYKDIVSGAFLAALVLFIAGSAAIPVGSSILNATRFFGMGEVAPEVLATMMYMMRSMLIGRSVLSLPGFVNDQITSCSEARRQGNHAMMTLAILSLVMGGIAGSIYSWGQIETTGKFLHEMSAESFPHGSGQTMAIQAAAFIGSTILNTFFVGNGTRDLALTVARVASAMAGSGSRRTALISAGMLGLSIPTFFPGVAFVTGGPLVKAVAAYSTLTSNDASLSALTTVAQTIILSEKIAAAERLINLLTGLAVLLQGERGAESEARRFSTMAKILEASIGLMEAELPYCKCGTRSSARAAMAITERVPAAEPSTTFASSPSRNRDASVRTPLLTNGE